jgi:hypothetical protein
MELNKEININDDADTVLDTGSDNETIPEVKNEKQIEKSQIKPTENKNISNRSLVNLILIDTLCKQPNLWFMQCGHIIRPYFRPIHIDSSKTSEFRRDVQYNPFRNTDTKFPQIYNEEMGELINRITIDIGNDESVLTYTDPIGIVRRPYFRKSTTSPIIALPRPILTSPKPIIVPKPVLASPKPIIAPKPVLVGKPVLVDFGAKFNKRRLCELISGEGEDKEDDEKYVYISRAIPFIPKINVQSKKPKITPVPPPPPPPISLLPSAPSALIPQSPTSHSSVVSTLIIQPYVYVGNCNYGNKCHRVDCSFKHPFGYIPQPQMCRNDKKCHNFSCKYKHSDGYIPCPSVRCRYGNNCSNKKDCYYSHPDDKWWNSIK